MQCFWPQLARLVVRRPAALTLSAPRLFIRSQSTCLSTRIPPTAHLFAKRLAFRANSTIPPQSKNALPLPPSATATSLKAPGGFKTCQIMHELLREKSLQEMIMEVKALPLTRIAPRRAAHIILHGLIRKGDFPEASQYAQSVLNRGVFVNKHSLQAIMQGLVNLSQPGPHSAPIAPLVPLKEMTILQLAPAMNRNTELTRSALGLWQADRNSGRQRSSHKLFRYLMVLCIVNGEIILASLLFGTLMREWQAREIAKLQAGEGAPPPPPATPDMSRQPAPHPEWVLIRTGELCSSISTHLSSDSSTAEAEVMSDASSQALACLAHAFHKQQIPNLCVGTLFKAMMGFPRGPAEVWIPPDGHTCRRVNAYQYIHDVMGKFLEDFPSRTHTHRRQFSSQMHKTGYTKLVQYALKHRHSIKKAKAILECTREECPEALLGMSSVVLRARNDFAKGLILNLISEYNIPRHSLEWNSSGTRHDYSVTIESMTGAGEQAEVIRAIPNLLPGIFLPRMKHELSRQANYELYQNLEDEGLKRAIVLGHITLTSIMNAARKLGNTNYCERIFRFGLEAERRSWEPNDRKEVRPWCFGVQTYTLMASVYGREMKRRSDEFVRDWGSNWDGSPLTEKIKAPELARRMLILVYRAMIKARDDIPRRLKAVEDEGFRITSNPDMLKVPHPDMHFFNTVMTALKDTPEDPFFAKLKDEMEAEGFEPPKPYINALQRHGAQTLHDFDSLPEARDWRKAKDFRPFAFPQANIKMAQDELAGKLPVFYSKQFIPTYHTRADGMLIPGCAKNL